MLAGTQYLQGGARVEGSVDAADALESAFSTVAGEVSTLRGAGRELSLGRAMGASDPGAGECGSPLGPRVELARYRTAVRVELEDGGRDRKAGGGLWVASS